LLGLVAALLLFRLGAPPLVGPDEPRYARVAVEMHRSRDWVVPTLQGRPWLEKPPLYYWLAAAAFSWLGENETAARLPSAAAALLLVGVTALFGARLYGGGAGLHAGFVLGTSLLPFVYGHGAEMDMLLAAAVTAAIGFLGLRLLGIAGGLAVPAAGVFIGLALLAKGPLGLLLPGLVVAGFVAFTREPRLLRHVLSPLGLALGLAVAAPWYLAMLQRQGQAFVDEFLLAHNVQRFTSTVHHHPGSIFYYLPVLALGLVPWAGLLVPALARVARQRSRVDLFVLAWIALPLVFFSAAGSKLPGYILPCLPPLALLMGRSADDLLRGDGSAAESHGAGALGLILALPLVASPALLVYWGEPIWRTWVPVALWSLLTMLLAWYHMRSRPAAALAVMRTGAAGLLLLIALAAPEALAHRESGRELFRPAEGREVLVWGAWRTAWMAGYFYNDGHVREVAALTDVWAATGAGPALVLCSPAQRRELEATATLSAQPLAEGPRGNALLQVRRR
jgi:4-amino-4-deoxy-L-arabinose transferase-like glycosyltransferase